MLECEWNPNDFPASLTMTPLFAVFNKNNNGSNGSSNNYNNSSSSSKDSNNILHIWEEFFLARDWSSSFLLAATFVGLFISQPYTEFYKHSMENIWNFDWALLIYIYIIPSMV